MDQMLPVEDVLPEEINHAVLIRRSRPDVFQTLTSADGWNAWFTTDGSFDFRPGGTIVFHWKEWGADHVSTGDHGMILSLQPNRLLDFTWHPDQPGYATRVAISLEDDPAGCVVRLRESGFADTPEGLHALIQSAVGWGEALTLLKMYLEHRVRY